MSDNTKTPGIFDYQADLIAQTNDRVIKVSQDIKDVEAKAKVPAPAPAAQQPQATQKSAKVESKKTPV
jgi:hypothetical protein